MRETADYIDGITAVAEDIGFSGTAPIVLSKAGNLVVHLAPRPVVARLAIAAFPTGTDSIFERLERELSVARHLHARGVPVSPPMSVVDAGPYEVCGTWMTLWELMPSAQVEPLSPGEAVEKTFALSAAMESYHGELPALGVWERTCGSASRLRSNPEPRVGSLLRRFDEADERMRSIRHPLNPCHGDAHTGNLMPSPRGWLWTDFEDASLMPAYWDHASLVGNRALFTGFREPTLRLMLSRSDIIADMDSFAFALIARTLMSTLGNLDYALEGYGDLDFAERQLQLAGSFIDGIERGLLSI